MSDLDRLRDRPLGDALGDAIRSADRDEPPPGAKLALLAAVGVAAASAAGVTASAAGTAAGTSVAAGTHAGTAGGVTGMAAKGTTAVALGKWTVAVAIVASGYAAVSVGTAPSPAPVATRAAGAATSAVTQAAHVAPVPTRPDADERSAVDVARPAEPANVTAAVMAPSPVPSHPAATRRHAPKAAAVMPTASTREPSPAAAGDVAREIASLDHARALLAQGRAAEAIGALDRFGSEFPDGQLAQEAQALRIDALAGAGQPAAAERLARAFLERYPTSPQAARVRGALRRWGEAR